MGGGDKTTIKKQKKIIKIFKNTKNKRENKNN